MPTHTSAAAWALRKVLVGLVLGAVVATVGIVGDARAVGASPALSTRAVSIAARPTLPLQTGWRRDMLARVNALRAAAGVRPLRPCAALRRSAQRYATLMATDDHYGHVGPDGSQPWERMRQQGYAWRAAAENIAAGQLTVEHVMSDWMASAPHYADLVNPAFRHVGFGHAHHVGSTYGNYWVQNFGRGRGC